MRLLLKILTLLLPVVVIAVSSVGLIAYDSLQGVASHQARGQLQQIARNIQQGVDAGNDRITNNLDVFTSDAILREYLGKASRDDRVLYLGPVRRKIQALQNAYPEYLALELFFADGEAGVGRSANPEFVIDEAIANNLVALLKNGDSLIQQHITPDFGRERPHVYVAKPILAKAADTDSTSHRKVLGYAVALLDASDIVSLMDDAAQHNGLRFLLEDANGRIILSDQRSAEERWLAKVRIQHARSGGSGISLISHIDDEPYLSRKEPLLAGSSFIALKPLESLTSATLELTQRVAVVTLVAAIVASLILYLIVTQLITRPLLSLSRATQVIAEGHLDINVDLPQRDEVGDLGRALNDMSRRLRQSTDRIEELAYFDALTGLPNKSSFVDRLQRMMAYASDRDATVSVLLFDLDNFKTINESLGHHHGDELLKRVAERVIECVDEFRPLHDPHHAVSHEADPVLARLGGDEFTIGLPPQGDDQKASKLALRILARLSQPFAIAESEVFVGASIGVATYPHDGDSTDLLMKHADIAMYEAKSRGKNNVQFFDQRMNDPINERLSLESAMRAAIDNHEFQLYYQPKVPTNGERSYEFEALIRWKHPQRGFISPGVFIPIAEETGLIQQISEWVFDEACHQIKRWLVQGYHDVRVSVNLSPVQMNYGNPVGTVSTCLKTHDIPAHHLEVEITESGLMHNEQLATATLRLLKESGVQIALDDFGTGYSSLAYLRRFPIDVLKVDRAFIKDMETDTTSVKVLDAVLSLAKSLALKIVAEGVETEAQCGFLTERRCDFIQGFFFARPSPPDEAMQFFVNHYRGREALA